MTITFSDRQMNEFDRLALSKGIDKCLIEIEISKDLDFTIKIENNNTYITNITIECEDADLKDKLQAQFIRCLDSNS